jgi:hypothetical protein
MSMDPMHTPGDLNWDPANVDMPEIPMLPPGEDAMSMTISGVLPTLTAPMAASVAALQAKETMFSGKLGSAQSAYQNADDQGGQSVGQFGQMLGQLGQMAGQAGAPAQQLGQQAGQFGSMIQQAMQGAKGGGGSQGGQPAGGQSSAGAGSGGVGSAPPQQARDDAAAGQEQSTDQRDRDEREKDGRDGRPPLDSAASGAAPHGAGPAPVVPPQRGDGDDLERRM